MPNFRRLTAALLSLFLLLSAGAAAAEEPLYPIHNKNADDYLLALYGPESGVQWVFQPWSFSVACERATVSGEMNEALQVTSVTVAAITPEESEWADALNQMLDAFFDALGIFMPGAYEVVANGNSMTFIDDPWKVSLQDGICFSIEKTDGSILFESAQALQSKLENHGILVYEGACQRSAFASDGYLETFVQLNEALQVTYVQLTCNSDNPEYIKGVLDTAANNLLWGAPNARAGIMINEQYDQIAVDDALSEEAENYTLFLYKGQNEAVFRIIVNQVPGNALSFLSKDSLEDRMAALENARIQAEEEQRRAEEEAAAQRQAAGQEALASIDTTAQIEPTMLYSDGGLTVTALALVYDADRGGGPAIGVQLRAEKAEGVTLERLSVSADSLNRFQGRISTSGGNFNSTQETYGSAAAVVEDTLWYPLSDVQAAFPGFAGISSLDLHVNIHPAEQDWIHSDPVRLSTGLAEAPLPGRLLFSQDGVAASLTGAVSEADDRGRVQIGLALENETDEAVTLYASDINQRLNEAPAYYVIGMLETVPAHSRVLAELDFRLGEANVQSLAEIESLTFDLVDYDAYCQDPWSAPALACVALTAADLGASPEEIAAAQFNPYAEELPEQVLCEADGMTLRLLGLSKDGQSVIFQLENSSDAWGEVGLKDICVNGWQMDDHHDTYTLQISANGTGKYPLNLGRGVPDFNGYADIRFTVSFYRDDPENAEPEAVYYHMFVTRVGDEPVPIALTPVHPAEVTYQDAGDVLLDADGVRLLYQGRAENTGSDLEYKLLIINETDKDIRLDDSAEPLYGASPAFFSLNGKEGETYGLIYNTHVKAGMRSYARLIIRDSTLADMGFTPEELKTLDMSVSLFPDNYKNDYVTFPVHIDLN